jgi:hypothetical protein
VSPDNRDRNAGKSSFCLKNKKKEFDHHSQFGTMTIGGLIWRLLKVFYFWSTWEDHWRGGKTG